MKIEKFPLGILGANCYLLINEETKDTVVVDPGGHSKKFTAYIEEEKLNLVAILLTHGHFDHIMGIDSILEYSGLCRGRGSSDYDGSRAESVFVLHERLFL